MNNLYNVSGPHCMRASLITFPFILTYEPFPRPNEETSGKLDNEYEGQ